MAFVPNPGFLTLALIEGSAAFILFVLYAQFSFSFSGRFFKYWFAGWAVYLGLEAFRIVSLWRGGPYNPPVVRVLSFAVAAALFAAVLEYGSHTKWLKYFWAWAAIAIAGLVALGSVARLPVAERWAESVLLAALYVSAGFIAWRSCPLHRGIGCKLLAIALVIRGLHGGDHPLWAQARMGLLRYTSEALLGIAMGIAMAVLILESGRFRTADLNERLRRLALITAEATQSFRVNDALASVLHHLVESPAATHGIVFLFDDSAVPPPLVLRASVGFSERFLKQYARVSSADDWVSGILARQAPVIFGPSTASAAVASWMLAEKLSTVAFINVPGKEGSLGLLGLGSSTPHRFQNDEGTFLINVANLLGLTIQNVGLFESAGASRRQWRDTFDSIDDLILVHSPDGRVLRANRAFTTRVNIEPAALIGRHVCDILRKGNTEWTRCPYCEGVAGKGEEPDATFGGYFLATDSAFDDSQGGRAGTVHVLKDVTSRRQAENKYRVLFEKVQEGIFISTPDGRFLDFNGAFMRILGYESREGLLQCDIVRDFYVHSADRQRLKRLLHQYGEVSDFEFQFRRRDGEIRTAHESSFATRDDSGAIVAYQGFLLDVTEQKRAEMDIRRRNRELLALNNIAELLNQCATLGEGLKDSLQKVTNLFLLDVAAVYFLDESTRMLKPSAQVGFESEYALRAGPVEISEVLLNQLHQSRATLLSGTAPGLPPGFRRLQVEEGLAVSQVVMLWTKDRIMGALLAGSRHAREFSTADLNLLEAVGNQIATTIDKSLLLEKTREAYETLRHTQEQLLQSEKMAAVGQLISGVAHELNNPLTAILGYSQLLQSGDATTPRGSDYVAKLHKQAQRTHHIVQSLLSFARQHKPERSSIHVNQIIEDTLLLREYDLRRNNIRVHREFAANLPPIGGDFHQLQQVVLNILNNAVDAVNETGNAGEIWIRTRHIDNSLQIEITDTGKGLKDPNRIFDPFYTTKPVGKGTGLGLSICYGIVKEHGGEIRACNADSGGACFTVVLPFSPFPEKLAVEPPVQSSKSVAGKVLLVDDDEAVLQIEQEILLSHGVHARRARSAWEALGILKSESVDAAVIDLKLPGEVSTESLYAWVEQNRPDLATRLIFTSSGAADIDFPSEARKSASHILTKPFQIEDFWIAVHKMLTAEVPAVVRH
jgi:two-component system NtrC family sensor kinase